MNPVDLVPDAEPETLAGFDFVVDARTPAEFDLDHAPGALNLPVLSNEQRAEVGTLYVQSSRFQARRVGGAYVANNVARHLQTAMLDWPASAKVLVYCWRGGMRSSAMAVILASVGWRTSTLQGGYRTYRRRVIDRLYGSDLALPRIVLLDGGTGSGKTEILRRLAGLGVQTLDLEALAVHRGSLLGALPGRPQPSQPGFETRVLAELEELDRSRPVVIEAESSKVGERMIPPALWRAMAAAPRIEVAAPPAERARYLACAYADIGEDRGRLLDLLARVPARPGRKRLEAWRVLVEAGDFEALAEALIELHYDPSYRRWRRQRGDEPIGAVSLANLEDAGLDRAAVQIRNLLGA
jgi:tRNA 2-selenouridine synthase